MNPSTHLASQLASLAVASPHLNGPSSLANDTSQRLRIKRSQRFTAPVQPPNPAASPPFSNSDESSAATTTTSNTSDAHPFPNIESNAFQAGMTSLNSASFPSNLAQTTAAGPPAFLQQDPFAFAGGKLGGNPNARSRLMSITDSNANQNKNTWAEVMQSNPQAFASIGGQSAPMHPNSMFDAFQNLMTPSVSSSNNINGIVRGNTQTAPGFGIFPQQARSQQHLQQGGDQDDIIPTAIVIKNIPFTFPSTSLLQIIEELTLSPPFAFNYHYDSGVFRGLAFANFHTPQETDACVIALNGFEIHGRKLRVEYKKVLQAGEKERIERDKAMKRMRSMQFERERLLQEQAQLQHQFFSNRPQQQQHQFTNQTDEWEDYGRAIHPSNSLFNDTLNSMNVQPVPSNSSHYVPPGNASNTSSSEFPTSSGASNSSWSATATSTPIELDMNDSSTLEIYSRVLLFKDDGMRDELAFSRSLTSLQRRIVHLVAQKMGLEHRSVGSEDHRHVVVSKGIKNDIRDQQTQLQQHQRLRSRASAHPLLSPDSFGSSRPNNLNTASALRKKSMPDLRHQQPQQYSSPSNQYLYGQALPPPSLSPSPLSTFPSPASLTPRHSNYDLRSANWRAATSLGGLDLPQSSISTLPSNLFPVSVSSPSLNGHLQGQSIRSPFSPGLANRQSLLYNPGHDADTSLGLAKAVGSPLSAASNLNNGLPGALLRQPRGPDATNNWARVVANGEHDANQLICKPARIRILPQPLTYLYGRIWLARIHHY